MAQIRRLKRGDVLLLSLVLALAAVLLGFSYWRTHSAAPGAVVVITNTAANTQQTYPLNKDAVLKVKGVVGESVIEIKDGRARFVSSPCQDQICVQVFGWIEKEYQLSFCSPNQILLQIKKEQQ